MSREFVRRTLIQGCREQIAANKVRAQTGVTGCTAARRKVARYSAALLVLELAAPERQEAA